MLWGAAAIIVAAAALVTFGFQVGIVDAATDEPVIDTGGEVEKTNCLPCHLDLGNVNQPGLIFSHGNHLMVSCDGCHARMPHKDGLTERVPMEVCFACHGVQHGPQGELATGECKDCHTPEFQLRPSTHVRDWKAKPHADAGNKAGVNGCMMCHDAPKDCDECHAKEAPDVPKMPDAYHTIIQDRPKPPSIKIYPEQPTSMAQCVYCHPDLDAITPGRLIFAHAEHLRRNYQCTTCHPTFGHQESGVAKPDMLSCYRCHGVVHAAQGVVATEECGKCHPKDFELMPPDHTKKFIKGDHKKRANSDPAYCAMCHESKFCSDCHRAEPVIPNDHKKVEWIQTHGGLYLAGDGACGSCHDDKSCKRCHQTVMPHPTGWIENHKPAPGIPTSDCNVCHQDRSKCQKCHHSKVERAELIRENCVGCHDEMKKKPATSIKHKAFSEHAVHFDVAKVSNGGGEPKRRPYTCDDCHIGYQTATSSSQHSGASGGSGLADAGHDVRLCYGCHGSLDLKNEIIAPWPGAQLCIRCHSDLNL